MRAETYDGQSSCIVDYSYEGAGEVMQKPGNCQDDFTSNRAEVPFWGVENDDNPPVLVMFKGDI